ncbi:hypothetical protein C8R45DRAFT_373254 [Mycena sanguinolenta]|nr:hypothetical protein C8R45DRAFT_373254 [Mycena sanguinolenta]
MLGILAKLTPADLASLGLTRTDDLSVASQEPNPVSVSAVVASPAGPSRNSGPPGNDYVVNPNGVPDASDNDVFVPEAEPAEDLDLELDAEPDAAANHALRLLDAVPDGGSDAPDAGLAFDVEPDVVSRDAPSELAVSEHVPNGASTQKMTPLQLAAALSDLSPDKLAAFWAHSAPRRQEAEPSNEPSASTPAASVCTGKRKRHADDQQDVLVKRVTVTWYAESEVKAEEILDTEVREDNEELLSPDYRHTHAPSPSPQTEHCGKYVFAPPTRRRRTQTPVSAITRMPIRSAGKTVVLDDDESENDTSESDDPIDFL